MISKQIIRSFAVVGASVTSAFAANTYNIFTDATGDLQFFQPNGTTPFLSNYFFEAGVITGSDFSPSGIVSNFISLGAPVNWDPTLVDTGSGLRGGASISLDYSNAYPVGVSPGQVIVLWAYDSKLVSDTSDWVVITNPSWLVTPIAGDTALDARDYTITDSGTVFRFGSLDGNKIISAVAIPEPSSFAALAGLSVLGLVAARRRRSA